MWHLYVALGIVAFWWFLLRPRMGGKDAPLVVTSSTVFSIPFVGVIAEFLSNPNEMMKRCYKDYGSVFTIPVRVCEHRCRRLRSLCGICALAGHTNV